MAGEIKRQGPHQLATNSTSTGRSLCNTVSENWLSSISVMPPAPAPAAPNLLRASSRSGTSPVLPRHVRNEDLGGGAKRRALAAAARRAGGSDGGKSAPEGDTSAAPSMAGFASAEGGGVVERENR